MGERISIMPCLDMQNGRVVKGVHFVDIRDAGDPVECAKAYCQAGADELALLDITATVENRPTMLEVVGNVAEAASVPFTVGGGISDVASAAAVLEAGADKVSTSSAAFRNPDQLLKKLDVALASPVNLFPHAMLAGHAVQPWLSPNRRSGFVLINLRMSSTGIPRSNRQATNSRRPSTGAGSV